MRPEDVSLSRESAGQQNARIERRQFLGAKTSYAVRLDGGSLLRVDCTGQGHDAHALCDTVGVAIDPNTALVLAS